MAGVPRRGRPPGRTRKQDPHEQTPDGEVHGPANCQFCRDLAYAYVEAHPRRPAGIAPGKDEWWVIVVASVLGRDAKAVGPHYEGDARERAAHVADLGLGLWSKLVQVVEEFGAEEKSGLAGGRW